MNKKLYTKLEDICASGFPFLRRLTKQKFLLFVDKIYRDLETFENKDTITEQYINDRIEGHISVMVNSSLTNEHIGTNH